jgi:hypothetical protein
VIAIIKKDRKMEDEVYAIIAPWAGIPTWYTGHQLDQNRFASVMDDLHSRFGPGLDMKVFEAALRRHAEQTPTMLGAPDNWDPVIREFAVLAKNY